MSGIIVKHGRNNPLIREKAAKASEAIIPGMLIAKDAATDTWVKHAVSGGVTQLVVAREAEDNADKATAYADGESIRGEFDPIVAAMMLQDGEVVVEGDRLMSNGDGTLVKLVQSGVQLALVAGGVAGAHVVTGIKTTDRIVSILHVSTAAAIATAAEIKGEFTISNADEIDNTAGTDTSADQLWVFYESQSHCIGYADEALSPSGADALIDVRRA